MNYTGYEHVKVTEPDNMAVEYKLTASEPNANLQVASQSVGSVQGGSAMDRRATGMLAVIQDMRGVRDSLPPRPSPEAVMTAHKEVSALDKDLIRQLAETAGPRWPLLSTTHMHSRRTHATSRRQMASNASAGAAINVKIYVILPHT